MTLDVAGKPVYFLIDIAAAYSLFTPHSGPISSEIRSFIGIDDTFQADSLFLAHGLYPGEKVSGPPLPIKWMYRGFSL